MFGKGVVEFENGDIIAGMFKVCEQKQFKTNTNCIKYNFLYL